MRKRGFTLIELLVVISIIALLMSMLMPALARVREQAKAVSCMARLKQWCLVFNMYCENNKGYFQRTLSIVDPCREYFQDDEMLVCPTATKTLQQGARSPFVAFNPERPQSYGINSYMINLQPEDAGNNRTLELMWKTPYVKDGAEVPMFMDMEAHNNCTPLPVDEPPDYPGEPLDGNDNELCNVCINRHNGGIHMAFMDFSVRKVGLKELWSLRWNRLWHTYDIPEPDWPDWMDGMN